MTKLRRLVWFDGWYSRRFIFSCWQMQLHLLLSPTDVTFVNDVIYVLDGARWLMWRRSDHCYDCPWSRDRRRGVHPKYLQALEQWQWHCHGAPSSRMSWTTWSAQLSNMYGMLSCIWCVFINTTAYHLGRFKLSSPSTREFHGIQAEVTTVNISGALV